MAIPENAGIPGDPLDLRPAPADDMLCGLGESENET
jgi:hypothetical protein